MLVERKYRSSKAHPVRQVRNLHNPKTNVDTYTNSHAYPYPYTHANSDAHADTNPGAVAGAHTRQRADTNRPLPLWSLSQLPRPS